MAKIKLSMLPAFIALIIFTSGCYKVVTEAGNQRMFGEWEKLTESHILGDPVPVTTDLVFFDDNNGIAEHVVQIRTTSDGGRSWEINYSFDKKAVRSLTLVKGQVAWLVGTDFSSDKINKPFILTSKDRGFSWQEVVIDKENAEAVDNQFTTFNDICFNSPKRGWIVGNAGMLEALTDGQSIKVISQFFANEELNNVSCGNDGEVWAVGGDGYVYHIQNGWNKKQINQRHTFRKVKLINSDIWLIGYQRSSQGAISGLLLRSKDKGTTWEDKTPEAIEFFSDLHLENGVGWLVGSDGNIYYSDDNGDSWKKFQSPTQNNLENIYFLDKKNIWIGGINQTVLKFKTN